jgi:hypothetical protein
MNEEHESRTSKPAGRSKVEIVGLFVLVVSVLLVAYELYQSRQLSVSERMTAAAEVETSLRDLVASNSDVWVRGCTGQSLSTDEQAVFTHTFQALFYRSFTLWAISKIGTSDIKPAGALDRMARSAAYYTGIRKALEDLQESARIGGSDVLVIEYVDAVLSRSKRFSNAERPGLFVCGW